MRFLRVMPPALVWLIQVITPTTTYAVQSGRVWHCSAKPALVKRPPGRPDKIDHRCLAFSAASIARCSPARRVDRPGLQVLRQISRLNRLVKRIKRRECSVAAPELHQRLVHRNPVEPGAQAAAPLKRA
jgi:hypothetical protein